MRCLFWGALAFSGVACAQPLLVRVVAPVATSFRPTIVAFGRVHGPNHTVLQAPYDALMGPLLVAPGSSVSSGTIIVRLLPLSLAGKVRALNTRVLAAKTAYQQGRLLAHQGLITPARARALRAVWRADVETLLADTARLARGVVRAPFAGTVRYRAAPGVWLTRGALVADIAGRGGLYETADLTVHQADQLFVGAQASLHARSDRGAGRMYALAERVDSLGLVRAYVRGITAPLRPGQVVRLTLWGHRIPALALPRAALIVRHAKPWVYVLQADHAKPVAVVVEHLGRHQVFVAPSSLARKGLVIDSGVARLHAGTAVLVSP